MNAANSLSLRIRTLREQKNLTQAALAAEIGISRAHLTKIERGSDAPGRETLVAIANYFNASLDWLTTGYGELTPSKALNEDEAILLDAYRRIPKDEAKVLLKLILARTAGARDA